MDERDGRRAFLTIASAGALLAACREKPTKDSPASPNGTPSATTNGGTLAAPGADKDDKDKDDDVSATEDLMREHGVIRRVLYVYRESAARLRAKPASVPPDALQNAAKLIRSFAEDYHEKKLEEANIFPALMKKDGPLATTANVLISQHQRGREITEYVIAVTAKTIGAAAAEPLAKTLESFARMYEEHAAIEDTIIFPAWKKTLSKKELEKMGDLFEDIEHKTFGKDGFDDAVQQIAAIEKTLGIELAGATPPPPPKV